MTEAGRCDKHAYERVEKRAHDEARGGANERGYTYRWQKASKAFLRLHPLCQCEDCDEGRKRVLVSNVVDHKVPHRGDPSLFWDQANWQAMNKHCHDRKTVREDGAFGRRAT